MAVNVKGTLRAPLITKGTEGARQRGHSKVEYHRAPQPSAELREGKGPNELGKKNVRF